MSLHTKKFAALLGALLVTTPILAAPTSASALQPLKPSSAAPHTDGVVTFDCLLQPFQSGFRIEGTVAVTASSDDKGSEVELTATMPDIPALAPVPIDGGAMTVVTRGTVADQAFELVGTRVVEAEANAAVPVPAMTGKVQLDDQKATVAVKSFSFSFEEMMGLNISAECDATRGGDMGAMKVSSDDAAADATSGGAAGDVAAAADVDESGFPVLLLLWAVPVLAAAVGGVLWWRSRQGAQR